MSETFTVGDLVAEFLQHCGVETAFGVVSIHNIPMLDAIGRRNAIRFVPARGEAGGGHMADAYARIDGGLGVLFTSTGPGAANAAGALVEARFAGTPLLHITGQTATGNIDRGQGAVHDVPAQLEMLRAVSKAAYRVRSPEGALGTLSRAAAEALCAPRGPVSVEIPIDIQRSALPRPDSFDRFALPLPPARTPAPALLEALVNKLAAARRPMLWLGSGARHAGEAANRLASLGIPLVTSWNGRGVVPEDHPLSLGPLNATPEVEAFYRTVDLMVIAGTRLRGHETRDMTLALPAHRVQIDADAAAEGRTYTTDLFLCADAEVTLRELADRLGGRMEIDPGYGAEIAEVRRASIEAYREYLGPYAEFPNILREVMPRDAVWARDITLNNSTWGNRLFPLYGPRDSVYPIGAAIGPGLPFGIGAALAAPGRKTVCMCGNGGFALSLAELWTAKKEQADVVFLVMNDGGYGVIRHIQNRMYGGRNFYDEVLSPELESLAALVDMPFERVQSTDQLGPSVAAALAVDGPALVEVDMAAIGEFPAYFAPPPYAADEAAE